MKFTPEVVAALKVLRDNAKTDFERHRIDVLERDLREPPKVEIVDDTHQRFLGLEFCQKRKGYFTRDVRIHRLVWQYYFGEIPDDCQIHHIDKDKKNNDADNLQLMTASDHQRLHHQDEKQGTFICAYCGKKYTTRDTGRNKFCSKFCLNHYRYEHRNDN